MNKCHKCGYRGWCDTCMCPEEVNAEQSQTIEELEGRIAELEERLIELEVENNQLATNYEALKGLYKIEVEKLHTLKSSPSVKGWVLVTCDGEIVSRTFSLHKDVEITMNNVDITKPHPPTEHRAEIRLTEEEE